MKKGNPNVCLLYLVYQKINTSNTLNEKREFQYLSFISGRSKNQPRRNEKNIK